MTLAALALIVLAARLGSGLPAAGARPSHICDDGCCTDESMPPARPVGSAPRRRPDLQLRALGHDVVIATDLLTADTPVGTPNVWLTASGVCAAQPVVSVTWPAGR